MSANYVLLEKITVGAAGASSVTFANIPQTGYTDLVVKMSARGDAAFVNNGCFMQLNSVTTGYNTKDLYGDGATAASSNNPYGVTSKTFIGAINGTGSTSNTFGNKEIYIPNYTSSNQKSISTDSVIENNGTTAYIDVLAGLCTTTAAITSLTFTMDSGNFAANSTFYLYGVAKLGTTPAIAPKATGGNIVMTDGTYWYHAFRSSGTFTPAVALSCDMLVVAGGGGGGRTVGGGGGAGGLLGFASQSLTATGYTITVGAGGPGGTSFTAVAGTGSDSQFGALTLVKGGGGGGGGDGINGFTGGSGGGGGGAGTATTGGAGTSSQGFAGSAWGGAGLQIGGGGGGSSAAATNKNGANGLTTYSAWGLATGTGENVSGTVYYAGGGGAGTNSGAGGGATVAGTGGYGGGAAGRTQASAGVPTAAAANTGGGGGGSGGNGDTSNGGAGGSGIVIVRYLVA